MRLLRIQNMSKSLSIVSFLRKTKIISSISNRYDIKLFKTESQRHSKDNRHVSTTRLMQYVCKESEAQRRSLIVLIAFIVGYTPLFALITISWCTNLELNSNYFVTLTWLGYLSSALNPSLYAWMNRNLKRAFYLIITCNLNKKQSRSSTNQLLRTLNNNNSNV